MPNKQVALPVVDPARCSGCGWCVAACPDNLLVLESIKGKKSASLINADVCPGCAKCILVCNFGAIRMKKLIAQKEKAPEGASVAR